MVEVEGMVVVMVVVVVVVRSGAAAGGLTVLGDVGEGGRPELEVQSVRGDEELTRGEREERGVRH